MRCYGGKNYPQNLLEKVKQLHYSNYSQQLSKTNKNKIISMTLGSEECFSTRPTTRPEILISEHDSGYQFY